MSRQTVKRSDLTGYAGYGYCAARSRFFWGCRGLDADHVGVGEPESGKREVVAAMLTREHHLVRVG